MTVKLYDSDSHLYTFQATVLRCDPDGSRFAVELDRTAFFPEGGGQYADTGKIGEASVLDVQETDNAILHFTDRALPVGAVVTGTLDSEKRFVRMQNHSGEHIVSGIIHRLYGLDNVGFHLGDGDMTVDYNGNLTRSDLDRVEAMANEAVARNIPITAEYPDARTLETLSYRSKLDLTENVRIVTIGDIDCCACCAPHVSRTGEIGAIKLLDFEHYKGGVRIHMLCGAWAIGDYRIKYDNVQRISALLCVPQAETADAVERLLDSVKEKDYVLAGLRRRLAVCAMDNAGTDNCICFFADEACDMDSLRHAVNLGMQRAVLCAGFLPADGGFRYCIGSATTDLRAQAKTINTALNGRGGGQTSMIQGSCAANAEDIRAFFKKWQLNKNVYCNDR